MSDKYEGVDNNGKPKKDYLERLFEMTDDQLRRETSNSIWLSSFAANNPRSDYHWQCDACFDESEKRPGSIYSEEHEKLMKEYS